MLFCFLACFSGLDDAGVEEGESLRLLAAGGGAAVDSEAEVVVVVVVRLVLAVEGF